MISPLFGVSCPTPDGQTAKDLYDKRVGWISDEARESARAHLVTNPFGG